MTVRLPLRSAWQRPRPDPLGPGQRRHGRLQFLDCLRGIAALAVALQHGAELLWPDYLRWSVEVFRPGEYGVFVFFLCSGFIIPASLERHNSFRRFWIGRFFRLFPLYWFALLTLVVLWLFGAYEFPVGVGERAFVLNLTMVQNFLGVPNIIGASWSLAYEMCFYLAASALFLAGVHKKSVSIAFVAICAGAAGGMLIPSFVVTEQPRIGWPLAFFSVICFSGLLLMKAPRELPRQIGIVARDG